MSATKDPTTKIRFVYQNLYQLYREEGNWTNEEAISPSQHAPFGIQAPASHRVLKTGEAQRQSQISKYQPSILSRLDIAPEVRKSPLKRSEPAREGLVNHFKATAQFTLNDIQKLSQPLDETLELLQRSVEKTQAVQKKIRTVLGDLKEFTAKRNSKISFSEE